MLKNEPGSAPKNGRKSWSGNTDKSVFESGGTSERESWEEGVHENSGRGAIERNEENARDGVEEGVPGKPKNRFGWKTVLLILLVLAVVGSLIQMVVRGGGFGGALNTTGEGAKKSRSQPQQIQKPKQPKMIKLGGHLVPRSAGAIIVVNPGLVAPGGKAAVQGAGFGAKSTVDLLLKTKASDTRGKAIGTVKADRNGSISASFTTPEKVTSKPATLVAQQRSGDRVAQAQVVSGGGIGAVKLNKAIGRPGDSVSLSIRGFGRSEPIDVYWGRVGGTPLTTLTADPSGGIGRADIKVGVVPTGNSTLVLVGRKSKTTATAPFQMMGLYPSLKPSPYAVKSGHRLTLSAKGFAPSERVLFYINTAGGIPAFAANADASGMVRQVAFQVPFGLRGKQSVTAIGDQTRAVVRTGFQVTPYAPAAEPSAYAGKAGTSVSFYVTGFAAREKVTIYAGGSGSGPGKRVGTFQVDEKGAATAVGSYKITKADEGGVSFRFVGQTSNGTATAGVNSAQGKQSGSGDQGQ
jgi:hypothetical protein